MLSITPISAFRDNYIWLITDPESGGHLAFVVDPGDADPVLEALEQQQLRLAGILVTHHHPDHVGGIEKLLAHTQQPVIVYGPDNPEITTITHRLTEGDQADVLGVPFSVLAVPGHTLDHIAFFSDQSPAPILFCGDTLFAAGCGRLFEGTPVQMHGSLQKIADLPSGTTCYGAHEYTLANLDFATTVEPDNKALQTFKEACQALREQGAATLPTTIDNELRINPFLRCSQERVKSAAQAYVGQSLESPVEVFRVIREWKDHY